MILAGHRDSRLGNLICMTEGTRGINQPTEEKVIESVSRNCQVKISLGHEDLVSQ